MSGAGLHALSRLFNHPPMEALGPVVGDAVFLAALVLTGLLERLQIRLRATEKRKWWGSSGRDVINVLAFGTMAWGLSVVRFTGPVALAIAASLLLLVTAIQSALGERKGSGVISLLAAGALGLPVIAAPSAVNGLFRSVLDALFG
jgi:hypothetical protein